MSSTYNETRVNYRILEANGQAGETEISVKEDKVTELMEELTTEGKGRTVDVLASQTYTFHTVSETDPITDFVSMVPSVEEQANLINRSIVLKQQQFVRRSLMGKDFTPVEGACDLYDVIGAKSERQSATPQEKAANALSKLLGRSVSVDELSNIIASLGQTAVA
jgi:predicted aconitase